MPGSRSVLIIGATGLVGSECLKLLAADPAFEPVFVLTRRPLPPELPRPATHSKIEERVVDFDRLRTDPGHPVPPAEQVVCGLGTTIRQAGSRERFRQVDLGYPLAVARLALERGARHFLLVSAIGASARSRIFYNRVKGELEDAIGALPYRSITIVRPSLLLGERRERRPAEEIGKRLGFLAPGRYRPVPAAAAATALALAARDDRPGRRIIESRAIVPMAGSYRAARG